MNMIVVYRSRTGFTRRYAKWIASELGCEAVDFKDFPVESISQYDLIIYGGRVYAGKIDGYHKFQQVHKKTSGAKLAVFAVGLIPVKNEEMIQKLWKDNLQQEESQMPPHFYMQGGLDYEKMGRMDRLIIKAVAKSFAKKETAQGIKTGNELDLQSSIDLSSMEYVRPLIQWARNYNS